MKFLFVVVMVAGVLQLGIASTVNAQTPSPTGTPSPSASPPAAPSPSPTGTGAAVPQRTSIPGHPLQLLFGPGQSGDATYTFPNVDGLPLITDAPNLWRLAPQAAPRSLRGYELVDASGQAGRDVFSTRFRFRVPAERLVAISAWTKTGDFVMRVVANSPVPTFSRPPLAGSLH